MYFFANNVNLVTIALTIKVHMANVHVQTHVLCLRYVRLYSIELDQLNVKGITQFNNT